MEEIFGAIKIIEIFVFKSFITNESPLKQGVTVGLEISQVFFRTFVNAFGTELEVLTKIELEIFSSICKQDCERLWLALPINVISHICTQKHVGLK